MALDATDVTSQNRVASEGKSGPMATFLLRQYAAEMRILRRDSEIYVLRHEYCSCPEDQRGRSRTVPQLQLCAALSATFQLDQLTFQLRM